MRFPVTVTPFVSRTRTSGGGGDGRRVTQSSNVHSSTNGRSSGKSSGPSSCHETSHNPMSAVSPLSNRSGPADQPPPTSFTGAARTAATLHIASTAAGDKASAAVFGLSRGVDTGLKPLRNVTTCV
eukprot:CAMPEP_0204280108 /NCGR_PEP_ID=MMETSP0468-20130131/37184_1 /ASSEMBLY_ACC=CAM_ASM_000383 /TAXON_ID=2969 /ORGANISM="Oxyrrhis marina" /LENGTH=125 /DNA_ID=CAMNT_0051257281 /DNA_START=64 /DNA_END=438 /DNA_ORIENTATION=+